MEYLTGYNNLALREAATSTLQQALSQGDEVAVNNVLEIYRSTIHQRNHTYTTYIGAMRMSASVGGLWADIPICFWTAQAIGVTINIYKSYEGTIRLVHTLTPRRYNTGKEIDLLFTGPDLHGHYTPLVPLTHPVVVQSL